MTQELDNNVINGIADGLGERILSTLAQLQNEYDSLPLCYVLIVAQNGGNNHACITNLSGRGALKMFEIMTDVLTQELSSK